MTEAERIEAEVQEFLVDRRHLDYIQTDRNRDLMIEWLQGEGLAISATSLHAAYEALHDQLDVHEPISRPVAQPAPRPIPQMPPAPAPLSLSGLPPLWATCVRRCPSP